ncbi:MAG: 1-(5-phosphoribosyl)-5-[(5-phosphoribosylamino)methylideneamino]imidazole-4-carboxamide isomerase [Proteobacteria bacterium]|nr:1-(5-phosphoribosyl)-5-[(5-phosphoribosylamino)methylideneamino]imidazole-4-carboxamide isomerase [Pseudomonadota bacterium]
MNIYPAIDLMSGRAVRLDQGQFDKQTVYETTPIELVQRYSAEGARYLHLVDLDGARQGTPAHTDLLLDLVSKTGLSVQVGGGIRSLGHTRALLQAGADRVVLGSIAVAEPALTQGIVRRVGPEHITLAVDVRIDPSGEPRVATDGWQKDASLSANDLIERYQNHGVSRILCTDISRDGQMRGPNLALYRDLAGRFPDVEVLASGGVSSLDDLRVLAGTGVHGVIIGKALLQGAFTLKEALAC